MSKDELREDLAALEHDQWAHWTRYMIDTLKVLWNDVDDTIDTTERLRATALLIYNKPDKDEMLKEIDERLEKQRKAKESLERWELQIETAYADLTEKEKDSDRVWADKVLKLLHKLKPEGLSKGMELRANDLRDNARYIAFLARDSGNLPLHDGWGAVIGSLKALSSIFERPDDLHGLVTCYSLQRNTDVTGISGTGIVAHVTLIRNPRGDEVGVLVDWLGDTPTHIWHRSMASVEQVHCHGGASVLVEREVKEAEKQSLAIRAMLVSECRTEQWGWVSLTLSEPEG